MESDDAVGLNKELVRVGAGAGAGDEVEGEAYASAEETVGDLATAAGVVADGSGGTGGSEDLGADFAEDE